jgi:hypothetical protein
MKLRNLYHWLVRKYDTWVEPRLFSPKRSDCKVEATHLVHRWTNLGFAVLLVFLLVHERLEL